MEYLFETSRLKFRELTIEDAASLSKVLSNEESMKYYPKAFSKSEVIDWIKWNIESYKINGFGLWAVIRKTDDEFLGDCGITMQNINNEMLPEVGFHIIGKYCMNGYATEAAIGSIKYVFNKFSVRKIFSYSNKDNIPSQCVMKNIGMKYLSTFQNIDKDNVVYWINANDT